VSRAATLPLILASASPRRRELLAAAGVAFEVQPAGVPETQGPGEAPLAYARRLAREKALAVARRVGRAPRRLVLGADTIVILGDEVLGKPADPDEALALLRRLVGRRHRVVTAVALVCSNTLCARETVGESTVEMRGAGEGELRAYVATGEPLDKAGAYALQGHGRRFVLRVEGSESNVIGLPLAETLALLSAAAAEPAA
jgi:septum formation protein